MQTGEAIYGDVVHRFAPEAASVPEARRVTREYADGLMEGETIYFDLATLCEQTGLPLDAVRAAEKARTVASG